MDKLHRQVRRARRRLLCGRFATAVAWALSVALLMAVVAIAAPKLIVLGVNPAWWAWSWLGGALGLAVLAAALWTWLTCGGPLDAAIEVDRRCHLRERVSSTLALGPVERDTPVGRALVADAGRAIGQIDVGDRFPIRPGRIALLPLLPALIAFVLVLFVDNRGATSPAPAATAGGTGEQIRRSTETLRRKLAARRREAQQRGLKDAEQLLRRLEQGVAELDRRQQNDKKKTLVQLNDLARQLEQRRRQIIGSKSVREQLGQLKQLSPGPAEQLAEALKKGDFRRAAAQLDQLQRQIRGGALDTAAKAQLAEQLGQMQDKLKKLADAHQAALDELRTQIEQAQAADSRSAAARFQQMFDQLADQQPQMDQLARLASQLSQCAQCVKQGDGLGAVEAINQLATDLAVLEAAHNELELMNAALAQIGTCKGALACSLCSGAGCSACQSPGQGLGQDAGQGLGQGSGFGPRPEDPTATSAYDSQVRQRPGPGAAVMAELVDGPNVKGRVLQAIQAESAGGAQRQSDPLADRRLPRAQREHAQEFFDRFREGGD